MRPPPTSVISISRSALRTRWSNAFLIPCPAAFSTPPQMERRKRWEYWARGGSRFRILPLPREIPWRPSRCSGCTLSPTRRVIASKAEQTLELLAGLAGKFGIFAATYGIAAVHLSHPHTQVVVIGEDDWRSNYAPSRAGFFAFPRRCSSWRRTRRSRKICRLRWRRPSLICPRSRRESRWQWFAPDSAVSLRSRTRNNSGEAWASR